MVFMQRPNSMSARGGVLVQFFLLWGLVGLTSCGSVDRGGGKRAPALERLGDGVYFRVGNLETHGHCNNGVVVFDDFVLVVDANFPDGARECRREIRTVTDRPVRFVFDTHHHGDHAYGNPVWALEGAVPMAHENVIGEMEKYEPDRWRGAMKNREDIRALGLDKPMPPTMTYSKRLVMDDGTRRVEFLFFGTAHTAGDGFAYLPKQKILFTGDAVVNGPYNYMGDGHSGSWLTVLDALLALDVEIVAPGHGRAGDASLIQLQRDYIGFLRGEVAKGIEAGKTVAQMQESIEVPERLSRYVGRFFKDQIVKIHSEMTEAE